MKIDLSKIKTAFSSLGERTRALTSRFGRAGSSGTFGGMRSKLTTLTDRFARRPALAGAAAGTGRTSSGLQSLAAAAERAGTALQGRDFGTWGVLATIVLSTYFISDLTALLVEQVIPEPPSIRTAPARSGRSARAKNLGAYNPIMSRNLFNSEGLIPGEGVTTGATPVVDANGPAVKTSLPLILVGTVIMQNESRSLATLENKTETKVYPVQIGDEIPDLLRVTRIEARKVTFFNLKAGRNEFVDIPEDMPQRPRAGRAAPARAASRGGGIQGSGTQFNVPRTKIDETMRDLNKVLTQARAVPHFENGMPAGYKLFQIVPGSIYDELGLKNGDVITGLNGEAVTDPGKAFEMLNELKSAKNVELTIKRNGSEQTFSYDIGP